MNQPAGWTAPRPGPPADHARRGRFESRRSAAQQSATPSPRHPIGAVPSPKPVKHRHGRAMRAGHLDDEGGLDLVPGLGALDERQGGVHSDFAEPAVRQPAAAIIAAVVRLQRTRVRQCRRHSLVAATIREFAVRWIGDGVITVYALSFTLTGAGTLPVTIDGVGRLNFWFIGRACFAKPRTSDRSHRRTSIASVAQFLERQGRHYPFAAVAPLHSHRNFSPASAGLCSAQRVAPVPRSSFFNSLFRLLPRTTCPPVSGVRQSARLGPGAWA